MSDLPVVVIGAGPQGLAAAAHLLERGLEPLVLESGLGPASAVAEWGHVRLFSAWPELVDSASARLLEPTGWTAPDDGLPDRRGVDRRLPRPAGEGAGRAGCATTPGSPASPARAATAWSTPTAPSSRSRCTWSTARATSRGSRRAR